MGVSSVLQKGIMFQSLLAMPTILSLYVVILNSLVKC